MILFSAAAYDAKQLNTKTEVNAIPQPNATSGHAGSREIVKIPSPAANTVPAIAPIRTPKARTACDEAPLSRRRRPVTYTTNGAIATLTTSGYTLHKMRIGANEVTDDDHGTDQRADYEANDVVVHGYSTEKLKSV